MATTAIDERPTRGENKQVENVQKGGALPQHPCEAPSPFRSDATAIKMWAHIQGVGRSPDGCNDSRPGVAMSELPIRQLTFRTSRPVPLRGLVPACPGDVCRAPDGGRR